MALVFKRNLYLKFDYLLKYVMIFYIFFFILFHFYYKFYIIIYPLYTVFQLHPHAAITTLLSVSRSPFFFFSPSLHTTISPSELSVCSLSVNLSLFCFLVHIVHQIPHMSEIIWYFSFSDWLVSLSIIFSRPIHAVTQGKFFFFAAKQYSIV